MADDTLNSRYIALMRHTPKTTPAAEIAFILKCDIGTAYSLKSNAKYREHDPEQMRQNNNKSSRESHARARARARAKEMTISHAVGA